MVSAAALFRAIFDRNIRMQEKPRLMGASALSGHG